VYFYWTNKFLGNTRFSIVSMFDVVVGLLRITLLYISSFISATLAITCELVMVVLCLVLGLPAAILADIIGNTFVGSNTNGE
jgi:hypothetical protein